MEHRLYKLIFIATSISAAATTYLVVDSYWYQKNRMSNIESQLIEIADQLELIADQKEAGDVAIDALIDIESMLAEQIKVADQNYKSIDQPEELSSLLALNRKPAVLFFHRDGCGWCTKMVPVFEQVGHDNQFNQINFYSINSSVAQGAPWALKNFNQSISGYPFFIFIDEHNRMINNHAGFMQADKFAATLQTNFRSLFPSYQPTITVPQGGSCGQKAAVEQLDISRPEQLVELKTQEQLHDLCLQHKNQSVILLHMHGCGWCNKIMPIFYALAQNEKYQNLDFYDIDGRSANAGAVIKELYNKSIGGYPSILFLQKDGSYQLHTGFMNEEQLLEKLDSMN